jgi:hypothetical protein
MTSRTSNTGRHEVRLPRTRAGAGLGVIVLVAALTGTSGGASAASPVLPDLVADPPGDSAPPQVYTDASGTRLLLRFDGFVHNRGTGALEMRGSSRVGGEMSSVQQRIFDSDGGAVDTVHDPAARILFEPSDGHNHWHLRNAAGYALWNEARTAQVGASNKVGFCLVDSAHVDPHGPITKAYTSANTGFCRQGVPEAQEVVMGVSAGWRDVYSRFLPFQWVDISDVAPGRYRLRSTVDPDGVITEADEVNPAAFAANASTVNGYAATSFSRRVGTLLPSSIPLSATTFDDVHAGSPGPRQFRIDVAPRNGRLSQPTGVWFSASSVSYAPRLGYSGQDSFQFSARDANSQFPLHPVRATAAIGVGVNPAAAPAAKQPTTTAARTTAAPDVSTTAAAPGTAAIGQPVVDQHGSWVLVSAVAGRSGVVRMTAETDGVQLGVCRARAPAGASVTCRFDLPHEASHHHGADAQHVLASVAHVAGGLTTIVRASG